MQRHLIDLTQNFLQHHQSWCGVQTSKWVIPCHSSQFCWRSGWRPIRIGIPIAQLADPILAIHIEISEMKQIEDGARTATRTFDTEWLMYTFIWTNNKFWERGTSTMKGVWLEQDNIYQEWTQKIRYQNRYAAAWQTCNAPMNTWDVMTIMRCAWFGKFSAITQDNWMKGKKGRLYLSGACCFWSPWNTSNMYPQMRADENHVTSWHKSRDL